MRPASHHMRHVLHFFQGWSIAHDASSDDQPIRRRVTGTVSSLTASHDTPRVVQPRALEGRRDSGGITVTAARDAWRPRYVNPAPGPPRPPALGPPHPPAPGPPCPPALGPPHPPAPGPPVLPPRALPILPPGPSPSSRPGPSPFSRPGPPSPGVVPSRRACAISRERSSLIRPVHSRCGPVTA